MERNDLIDPNMSNQQMRLHFGEMTAQEMRTARAAIRFANSRVATTIASLSEALAEAEKKGAEDWQPINDLMPDDLIIAGGFNGKRQWVCEIWHTTSLRRELEKQANGFYKGSEHLAFALTHWRPLPAPPRDLSQGGQHG